MNEEQKIIDENKTQNIIYKPKFAFHLSVEDIRINL